MFDNFINHRLIFLCGIKIGSATHDFFDCGFFCNSSFREYIGSTSEHIQKKKLRVLKELIHVSDFNKLTKGLEHIVLHREIVYKSMVRLKTYTNNSYEHMYLSAIIQHNPHTNELEFIIPMNTEYNKSIILHSLTEREQTIYELIEQGFPSRSIAEQLCISPETVKTHRRNINKKLSSVSL